MKEVVSPSTGERYALARLCRVFEIGRSTVYAARTPASAPRERERGGPRTDWSVEWLLDRIRELLSLAPFQGEGHRTDCGWIVAVPRRTWHRTASLDRRD